VTLIGDSIGVSLSPPYSIQSLPIIEFRHLAREKNPQLCERHSSQASKLSLFTGQNDVLMVLRGITRRSRCNTIDGRTNSLREHMILDRNATDLQRS
jgi:hypothetical protein